MGKKHPGVTAALNADNGAENSGAEGSAHKLAACGYGVTAAPNADNGA